MRILISNCPKIMALTYLMHQISRTPSNSPFQGGEPKLPPFQVQLRLPPLQGGTEGGNLQGVSSI